MVKVSFNKALAIKDPKKENLIPGVQVRYQQILLYIY